MDQIAEAADLTHDHIVFPEGLALDCGVHLAPIQVAYRTYGKLSPARDNAVLICHALTGDQYVTETHPLTGRPGWWARMVGPGRPIDTNRFFVICSNVLGGCMGSTGPRSARTPRAEVAPANAAAGSDVEIDALASTARAQGASPEMASPDGSEAPFSDEQAYEPWGTDFPPITIRDMVRAQHKLVRHLGIERLFAVVGGSMGGMQTLEWAATYPDMVFAAMPIATSPFHSAQNIAFNEVSRQAISADPDWDGGRYWERGAIPARGLAVARMMAHITYLSEEALTRKFGRRVRRDPAAGAPVGASGAVAASGDPLSLFGEIFEVESYLRHQGSSFVHRFDANSYLTITRAMDWFDLGADHDGDIAARFANTMIRFCVVSFTSDWLFPTSQSRVLVRALNRAAANVSFVEIESDKGHDAFLLDEPDFERTVRGFIAGAAEHARLSVPAGGH